MFYIRLYLIIKILCKICKYKTQLMQMYNQECMIKQVTQHRCPLFCQIIRLFSLHFMFYQFVGLS